MEQARPNLPGGLERQMQRHLQKSRTADRMLNDTQAATRRAGVGVSRRPDARTEPCRRLGVNWRVAKEWIELNVIARDVETRMVEDIKCLKVVSELEPFGECEVFKYGKVKPALE